MRELLVSNGGQVAESAAAANTTHLVIDENNVELLPPNLEVFSASLFKTVSVALDKVSRDEQISFKL
jgi:hypothetical protein